MKKYQSHIIFLGLLLVFLLAIFFLGEIILPFIIGLLLAVAINPLLKRIQKFIPNRELAVTSFLVATVALFLGFVALFGFQVVKDFQRLNQAFVVFADDHQEEIDGTMGTVKSWIGTIYSEETLKKLSDAQTLSDSSGFDMETIKSSLSGLTAFFSSDETDKEAKEATSGFNWFLIFLSAIGYFVLIIYSFGYFEKGIEKYFRTGRPSPIPWLKELWDDFNRTFSDYFKQRGKVVLICMAIFLVTFLILGIPGAILLGILAGLLCYISGFHFLSLIPLSLCCWVRSMETGHSFFLYFGVILLVFILIAVLEEVLFFPRIMKGVSSMNSAIVMLSLALWGYLFGTLGVLIALPLTTVLMLYLGRLLLQISNVPDGDG